MLDDDLCKELSECADSDHAAIKKFLAKNSLKNKFTLDPTFATSPICIKDPDYDFCVDLSLISIVEVDPFYGRENDDAIEHVTKLTELGGSIQSPQDMAISFVDKYFPAHMQHAALQRIYNFK